MEFIGILGFDTLMHLDLDLITPNYSISRSNPIPYASNHH